MKVYHPIRKNASVSSGKTKSSLEIFHLRPNATKEGIKHKELLIFFK